METKQLEWYPVLVQWEDDSIKDEIKGTDPINALENARWNWEDAKEIKIGIVSSYNGFQTIDYVTEQEFKTLGGM